MLKQLYRTKLLTSCFALSFERGVPLRANVRINSKHALQVQECSLGS